MKRAREDENRDFDTEAREREEQRQDDATARADREFANYPPGWFDAGEPS